ncbi:MAG: hypothetical protein ABI607_09625 [Betaproteobacteria bacterium]
MPELDDPRTFPDAAPVECARLHALAAASQSAQGQEAAALDGQVVRALREMLAPGQGERLAALFATAPSVAIHRHLWRLLVECEQPLGGVGRAENTMAVTVFAIPLVIVVGAEGESLAQATICGVLDDAAALTAILRENGALSGNLTFALANVLTSAAAIDLVRLPEIHSWRALPEAIAPMRELEPAPITLLRGPETVHLRFLLGSAIAAPDANLLADNGVGKWGIPFAHALGRQLANSAVAPGVSVLALPRAPQTLLRAARQGRASQREVGAQIFASNAIRKLRASVGEPTAVISAHRAPDAIGGGEVRLSLSSPFDPREAEGFRCPLYPLDRVEDVVAMLTDLLAECRVTDVRVIAGVHADRDPDTGLPLLFKGDTALPSVNAVH